MTFSDKDIDQTLTDMQKRNIMIDPQELSNYLANLDIRSSIREQMRKKFDLPEPWGMQTMVITLHINVENMDPLGDTYVMGCNKIREIAVGPHPAIRLSGMVEKVDIVPRIYPDR
jgi:hypothetical protein